MALAVLPAEIEQGGPPAVRPPVDRAFTAGAVVSMLVLGSLLGDCPGWRHLGELGELAAVAVTALSLLDLPLTLTDHWVGLIERAYVLCVSGWFAALAAVVLHAARGGGPARSPPDRAVRRGGRA